MLTEDMLEKVMDFEAELAYGHLQYLGKCSIENSDNLGHVHIKRIYDENGRFVSSEKTWVEREQIDA